MSTRTATSQTRRELRTAGAGAVLVGILFAVLPGAPAGCWSGARLVPAIPVVAAGVLLAALGSVAYRLDRQADEIAGLRARIAQTHAVPGFAIDDEVRRRPWTKLPFYGLFLGALAISAALRSNAACPAGSETSGAAVGFAVAAVATLAVGLAAYRRAVATDAVLLQRLRDHVSAGTPQAGSA